MIRDSSTPLRSAQNDREKAGARTGRNLPLRLTMNAPIRFLICVVASVAVARAAEYPPPTEGDYVIRDFKFTSGETMP